MAAATLPGWLASEPTIAGTRSCAGSSVESLTKAGLCAIFLLRLGNGEAGVTAGNAKSLHDLGRSYWCALWNDIWCSSFPSFPHPGRSINHPYHLLNTSLRTRGECAIRKVRECNLQRPERATTRSCLQNRPLLPELSRNGVLPNICHRLRPSLSQQPMTI